MHSHIMFRRIAFTNFQWQKCLFFQHSNYEIDIRFKLMLVSVEISEISEISESYDEKILSVYCSK